MTLVKLGGNWSPPEELLYCVFYVKSLEQAGELGEEEANERLDRMGQSGASILPRKTAGPVPCFDKGNRPYGLFDNSTRYILLLLLLLLLLLFFFYFFLFFIILFSSIFLSSKTHLLKRKGQRSN
jgi:hypothetical protein